MRKYGHLIIAFVVSSGFILLALQYEPICGENERVWLGSVIGYQCAEAIMPVGNNTVRLVIVDRVR